MTPRKSSVGKKRLLDFEYAERLSCWKYEFYLETTDLYPHKSWTEDGKWEERKETSCVDGCALWAVGMRRAGEKSVSRIQKCTNN